MHSSSSDKPQLTLTHGDSPIAYRVSMEAFFELSFELAERLENLVDDWEFFVRKKSTPGDRKPLDPSRVKH